MKDPHWSRGKCIRNRVRLHHKRDPNLLYHLAGHQKNCDGLSVTHKKKKSMKLGRGKKRCRLEFINT